MSDRGTIVIHLDELLKEAGLSKNKFCQRAELQRSQLNGYLKNTITRLDTDVLVRMCDTLDCTISDLLEYKPNPKKSRYIMLPPIRPPIFMINSSGSGI